jgi:phosphomevalonate kinase
LPSAQGRGATDATLPRGCVSAPSGFQGVGDRSWAVLPQRRSVERALSAPSKLFLCGEYAVLWGGAARVLAVGPRAEALVRAREDRTVELLTSEGRLLGISTPLGVRWDGEVTPGVHFAARALDVTYRAHGRESLGLSLALAPSRLGPGGSKLGTGSSARTAVLAVEAAAGVLGVKSALPLALVAHAEAQLGKGSGADVVASSVGGLVRYRRWAVEQVLSKDRPLLVALKDVGPVDVVRTGLSPDFLSYAFAGQSAATPGMIAEAERTLDQKARAAFVAESDVLGDAFEDALRGESFAAVREACEALQQLLASLGKVVTPALERILALARSAASTGKVSGAGGGDGCLLLSPDAQAQTRLLETLQARGIHAEALALEPGVRIEPRPDPALSAWLAA